jgi:hypothetical protein
MGDETWVHGPDTSRLRASVTLLRNTRSTTLGFREHLDSPQFTDADGESTGETVFRIGGTWVKSGVPRWRGYLFYLISFVGGLVLVLTSTGGFDLLAMAGVLFVAIGVAGALETWRGVPFTIPGLSRPKDE